MLDHLRFSGFVIHGILCSSGICLVIGGSYVVATVDIAEMIGDAYIENVPPKSAFLGMKPGPESNNRSEEIDHFVITQFDTLGDVFKYIFLGILCMGFLICTFSLYGIVVFALGMNKLTIMVVYLTVSVPLFIGSIIMSYYVSVEENFQKSIFNVLEDIAYQNEPPNRFFMAAIQFSLKCCGVRGAIDYFCHGTYDLKCNPGCLTMNRIWKEMIGSGEQTLCIKTEEIWDFCLQVASLEDCMEYINVPSPVDATDNVACKNYTESFNADGRPRRNFDFSQDDPGKLNNPNDIYKVHATVYWEDDLETVDIYKDPVPLGCGFAAWQSYPLSNVVYYAFLFLCLVSILLGVLIVTACTCVFLIIDGRKPPDKRSTFGRRSAVARRSTMPGQSEYVDEDDEEDFYKAAADGSNSIFSFFLP